MSTQKITGQISELQKVLDALKHERPAQLDGAIVNELRHTLGTVGNRLTTERFGAIAALLAERETLPTRCTMIGKFIQALKNGG